MNRLVLALALAVGACDDSEPAAEPDGGVSEHWRSLAPLAAGPRQETAVVAVGAAVYVIGGLGATVAQVAEVSIYHVDSDAWSAGPVLPGAVHHANAAVVGDTVYLLGALQGSGFAATGTTLALAPGGSWVERTAMPAGSERGASAVGVLGTEIVVAGGFRSGQSVADVSIYDTVADRWLAGAPLPVALDHLVGAVVDDVVYVIGGRSNGVLSNAVYAYDRAADQWRVRAPLPTARAGCAAGALASGVIVVVGGEGNASTATGVFGQTEAYDPGADRWTAYDDMPTPRHGMGAAAVGNSLYVPGGATIEGFGAVDTHEVFALP
jgi:N-acetylneuraminic acid mutarotase